MRSLGLFIGAVFLLAAQARALTHLEIVQQPSQVVNLSSGTARLQAVLDREITKIVNAGPLMPFRLQYGEGTSFPYAPQRAYHEPWMMTYTLAKAYPRASAGPRSQIIAYVKNEIARAAPWSTSTLGASGAYRQGDPAGVPEMGLPAGYDRRGVAFYALWLYGSNTGDWSDIQPRWADIKTAFGQVKAGPRTYELISGAIGMARMATQFNDAAARTQYESDAVTYMNEGLAFATYRANAHTDYSGQANWVRGTDGLAFPLFHMTPEVARYINNDQALRDAVVGYVETLPTRQTEPGSGRMDYNGPLYTWPLWWMAQAPVGDGGYFGEGSAGGVEQRMMLFNYFAWIKNAPPAQTALWVDVPDALVGDCYFIQNLVTAIEQFGARSWGAAAPDAAPPVSPRNLRRR